MPCIQACRSFVKGERLFVFCLFLMGGLSSTAKGERVLSTDFPVLSKLFPVSQPADYVIALDRSGSMKRYWPQVLEALEIYLGAIADGDYVSIVGFGNDARLIVTPGPLTPEDRRNLLAFLRRLPPPSDGKTDLAAGIAAVLRELERPGGAGLKFVVLLTDFIAEPPATTPYPGQEDVNAPVWSRLREQAARTLAGKIVDVQALVLDLGNPKLGQHLPAVRKVFPHLMEQVIHRPEALRGWFQRVQAEMDRSKLRAEVQESLRQVRADVVALRTRGRLFTDKADLQADFSIVAQPFPSASLTIDAVELLDGSSPTCMPLSGVRFQQDPSLTKTQRPPGQVKVGEIKIGRRPLLKSNEIFKFCLAWKGTVTVEPATEIRKLALNPEVSVGKQNSFSVALPVGFVPPWLVTALLGLLLVVAVAIIRDRRPNYIEGVLRPLGGQPIPISRTREVFVGGSAYSRVGQPFLEIPGANFCLKLVGARRGDLGKGKPRGVYVSLQGGFNVRLEVDGERRPLGGDPTLLPYGARIYGPQVGLPTEMVLTWEHSTDK